MLNTKHKIIFSLLLFLLFSQIKAQYNGGTGDGYFCGTTGASSMNNQSAYCGGGIHDGHFMNQKQASANNQGLYTSGGSGDGYHLFNLLGTSANNQILYTSGGMSDGYHMFNLIGTSANNQGLYTMGGTADGYHMFNLLGGSANNQALYTSGGTADGYHMYNLLGGSANNQGLYTMGGSGDGYHMFNLYGASPNNQILYTSGGIGDGYHMFNLLGASPNNQLYTTGGTADGYTMGNSGPVQLNNGNGYCPVEGGCNEFIAEVFTGNINNQSDSCALNGYRDYTSLSTEMYADSTYTVRVVTGNTRTGDDCGIWIDWNSNTLFSDPGEFYYSDGSGIDTFNFNITVPSITSIGNTRMRIRLQYNETLVPCGISDYGEAEDYFIVVKTNAKAPEPAFTAQYTSICRNEPLQFTDQSTANPAQWQWDFGDGGVSSDQHPLHTYTSSGIYTVSLRVTNSYGSNILSRSSYITVNQGVAVEVAITAFPDTSICQGGEINFSAIPVNGGMSPTYQWMVNGVNTASGSTWNTNTLNNNDIVSCMLISSETCVSGNPAVSNNIAVQVNPVITLDAVIQANPSGIVCQGATVNFTATVQNGGSFPSYEWFVNGSAVGSNNPEFTSTNLQSGDIVFCRITSDLENCITGNPAISNEITMNISPLPLAAVSITGNTSVCQGENNVLYSVPVINHATSYIWTLPTGAIGTTSINSISVDYGNTAVSGNIKVKGNNSCSDGEPASLAIIVNPLPLAAGTIEGFATVCQGQTSVTYTVPSISNVTSFLWTLPTGATGSSSTSTITVNYGTSAVSGNITVKGHNDCGDGLVSSKTITVNPIPLAAGIIEGFATVCQGQTNVTYTVPTITNATSYLWTLPTGATGSSSTSTITVNYGTSAVSGNITVKGHNDCGDGIVSTKAIMVNPLPVAAGTIEGFATVCQGQTSVTYTVPSISNATSYVWTLPTGATGSSSTSTITVNFGTSAVSGNITVKGHNDCGDGIVSTKTITVNPLPLAAGTIEGFATVCQGQTNVSYTVPTITNATSYIWTLPTGATGSSSTSTITVNYGTSAVSGNITVKGHNDCGDGLVSSKTITVNPLPLAAGTIEGFATVCQGQTNVTYTVPTITNATSYIWTLPTGATGSSSTSSITVNYGASAVSGNITVKGHNDCGDGIVSTKAIMVNPLPLVAGTIEGFATVCQGQTNVTYTVPTITNATSYVWTLPTGATGSSSTSTITVNYGTSAVSGNITVKGHNDCGDGIVSTKTITVNPIPTVNAGNDMVICSGNTVTLVANGNATSFQWNNGITQNTPFIPENTSNYIVIATNQFNCSNSDTVLLTVKNKLLIVNALLEGLYANSNMMNNALNENSEPQWGANIADKVILEIRNASAPYAIIESLNANLLINSEIKTYINCNNEGLYFITIHHRNHLETWSSSPISFASDTISYNFTTVASKAYGDNQKEVAPGIFALLVGDVNQDGVVDISDLVAMDADLTNGTLGYIVYDLNGDGVVDISDLVKIDENLTNGVVVITP